VARILRGDIVWAELDPVVGNEQAGMRPVVVLSHDVFNERSGTVIAVAVTSQEPRASFPLTLEITSTKLPKRSLAISRLGRKLGRVSAEELHQIIEGINEIVGG
jgi:mRNA interferase MazF